MKSIKTIGWKAAAFLKLARLIIAVIVIWHALPMANALKTHFVEEGRTEFAAIGSVNYNTMNRYFNENFSSYYAYDHGSTPQMIMRDEEPQYASFVITAEQAVTAFKMQIAKIDEEAKYVSDIEGSYYESTHNSTQKWNSILDTKLLAFTQKAEARFGKEAIALEREKYLKNKFTPKTDWQEFTEIFSSFDKFWRVANNWQIYWATLTDFQKYAAIAAEGSGAFKLLMVLLFFYYLVKAKLYGFKLRFEILPHRALLGTILSPFLALWNFLCPVENRRLSYPFGNPATEVKSVLNFSFSILFYGLTLCSAGATKAQTSGNGNSGSKTKDEKVLVIDVRYGDTFDRPDKSQRLLKLTYLGDSKQKWLIESTTTDTVTALTQQSLFGWKFNTKPVKVTLVGGLRDTFQKNNQNPNSHSVVGGVQLAYRKPNYISIFVPAFNYESEFTNRKRKTINFGSQVIQERKKFDYGSEFTFRKQFGRNTMFQWVAGVVISAKPSKKLPRIEFGMFRNWLSETSWRIRLGYQFKF